jgi:predicted transcriptional regulator
MLPYLIRGHPVGRLKHRPSVLILMELLELLIREPRGPTRLAQAANLNYQKCDELIHLLAERGLIAREVREGHEVYTATLKGRGLFIRWAEIFEELHLS